MPGRRKPESGDRLWIAVTALVLSSLSILVSTAVVVVPVVLNTQNDGTTARTYFKRLVSAQPNSALAARSYTESGSDADQFASVVHTLWRALGYSRAEQKKVADGEVTDAGAGALRICFPDVVVKVFGGKCVTATGFEFGGHRLLERFALNRIPIDSLYRSAGDYEQLSSTTSTTDPATIHSAGKIYNPDGEETLTLLWITRPKASEQPPPIVFSSVVAQDNTEAPVEITESHFPKSLAYYADGYAVVRAPSDAAFFYVCWTGVQPPASNCEWVYRVR